MIRPSSLSPGIKAIQPFRNGCASASAMQRRQQPLARCRQLYRVHPDAGQPLLPVTALPMSPPRVSAQCTPATASLALVPPAPPSAR
jgi:hypothetical protein